MPAVKKADVSLDLDALERDDAPEPYIVTLGGKQYQLSDPEDVPYGDLSESSDGRHFIAVTVPEAQRAAFSDALAKMPQWKVSKLVDGYNKHFALPSAGEDLASRTS